MDFLPLFFNLKGRQCLLVGGGDIALRKATLLQKAGANIKVVAPEIISELRILLESDSDARRHELHQREYESLDLENISLVVSATDSAAVNVRVSEEAQMHRIPVNVVDQPELCTVIFPAIIDRSPVLAAVSSGGKSPVLTRFLREMLESLIGEGYSRLGTYLGDRRSALKARFGDLDSRRRHTEAFLSSPGAELAMAGKFEQADTYLDQPGESGSAGEVYIVGAGPGDPDLLTLKALQLMQKADVVLYDSLVSDQILDRVRRDAHKQSVGKRAGSESTGQETINDLLVRLAREGHRVLRLKGGDPFIFGRGGEEIETLAEHGIPFQVVPGITAATGCAAYAGIPLTHRDYSQSVRFVTGHPKDGEVNLEWQEFAHKNQTIVFY
ncbi:MAG: siroheme synthase CysG, partial [Pseudomonadales bacterium]